MSPAEQGELQGAASSLMGLVGLAGPGLFTASFAIAITPAWNRGVHLPGAPFLLAALMTVTSLSIAFRVARTIRPVAG